MPPMRRAATAIQDQTCPRHSSERKPTNRAASVPVVQQEIPWLVILRSKKQKLSLLDVEDTPPSGLPGVVVVRGRKRDASSHVTSQVDCVASTSASVAEQTVDADEQCPQKRHKRSSSQLSTQLRSCRRSRSRLGSPSTDMECVPPSRVSARLSRKIHPLLRSLSSDIYTHLADPDGARKLLSEPPVTSVIPSIPDETVGSQPVKKHRGHPRKITNLTDENAKWELMEEWARIRQSQGTLPLSGINENTCTSQTPLHGKQKSGRSVSSIQFEATARRSSPDVDLAKSQATTIIGVSQLRETISDVSLQNSSSIQTDSGSALLVGMDAAGEKLDHKDAVLPSDRGTEQPIVPSLDVETPSTSISDSHLDEDAPTDKLAGTSGTAHHLNLLQCRRSSLPSVSASPSRGESVHILHEKSTEFPANERTGAECPNTPKDGPSMAAPRTQPFDTGSVYLDSDEEFYMLDIPDIFTDPWVPVTSNLYVPPSLGRLISEMREQLTMEGRTRRRAEELYQTELSRRISAEKTIEDLRTRLEGKGRTHLEY